MSDDKTIRALWSIAQGVIEKIDPIVRSALAGTTSSQCTRCPLCAVNAAVGERSDELTSMLMTQGWDLLSSFQRFLDEHEDKGPTTTTTPPTASAASRAAYQAIPITIHAS